MQPRARVLAQDYEMVGIESVRPHPKNPRQGDVGAISESIEANGFYGAIVVQRSTGYVLAGNHRLMAARAQGLSEVPCVWVDVDDERAVKILLADNRTNDLASYNESVLAELLADLANTSDLTGTGYDGDDLDALIASMTGGMPSDIAEDHLGATLAERFGVPPFSVLNAREGWWQDRKRAWIALGIESEIGRGDGSGTPPHPPTVTQNKDGTLNYSGTSGQAKRFDRQRQAAAPGGSARPACDYSKRQRGDGRGRAIGG